MICKIIRTIRYVRQEWVCHETITFSSIHQQILIMLLYILLLV